MKTRRLGAEGPTVSAVGLGGMRLSLLGRPDEAQAIATVHAALDAGIRFIDTADVYCVDDEDIGHNERLVAKALQGRSEPVLIATKGGLRRPGGDWKRDGRPTHLQDACEKSLRALGVDCIDLYQLHAPDPAVPFVDSVGAIARLREQGKVNLVGLSNVDVAQIDAARDIVAIASVQNRWSPGRRDPERDGVLALCESRGIAFLPYSPFGGQTSAATLGNAEELREVAERKHATPHRLVIAWMLAKSPVAIPIPGARRPQTIQDSAAAAEVDLTASDLAAIEAAFVA